MNPSNTQTPNASATWGKPISVVALGATAVAIAIARLAQPAASHAEKCGISVRSTRAWQRRTTGTCLARPITVRGETRLGSAAKDPAPVQSERPSRAAALP